LFFFIASPLVCAARFAVRVEGGYRTHEFSARRPRHEQHSTCIGVPEFENALLSAPRVYSRFDADGIICQNLLDFGCFDPMYGDVSFIVLIPLIPGRPLQVNTLYRRLGAAFIRLRNHPPPRKQIAGDKTAVPPICRGLPGF
jgi:hypothetical protein